MEKNGTLNSFLVDGVVALVNAVQGNEIFQTIIFILTLLSIVLNIARNIYNWYNEAKSDGKIDADEVKGLIDIVDDGIDDIKKASDEASKKEDEKDAKK